MTHVLWCFKLSQKAANGAKKCFENSLLSLWQTRQTFARAACPRVTDLSQLISDLMLRSFIRCWVSSLMHHAEVKWKWFELNCPISVVLFLVIAALILLVGTRITWNMTVRSSLNWVWSNVEWIKLTPPKELFLSFNYYFEFAGNLATAPHKRQQQRIFFNSPPNLLQDSQEFIMSLHQLHVENFLLFVYLQT